MKHFVVTHSYNSTVSGIRQYESYYVKTKRDLLYLPCEDINKLIEELEIPTGEDSLVIIRPVSAKKMKAELPNNPPFLFE